MSTLPLTPTTELEAVNTILSAIGEAPVSDVDEANLPDAEHAVRKLRDTTRTFLARGWTFNTDTEFAVPRNSEGEIVVPAGALHIDIARSECRRGVRRGNRLWDSENHTFVWDRDLKIDVKWFMPFEDIPELARHYITVRAAREFAREAIGEPTTDRFSEESESQAWVAWLQDESDRADFNVFHGSVGLIANRSLHAYRGNR